MEVGGSALGYGDKADKVTVLAERLTLSVGYVEVPPGGMVDHA